MRPVRTRDSSDDKETEEAARKERNENARVFDAGDKEGQH